MSLSKVHVQPPHWEPTFEERDVFEEWKEILINKLMNTKRGLRPATLQDLVEEETGKKIPFDKMGLEVPNINHMLFEMKMVVAIRQVDGEIYVFIEEFAVPPELDDIRQKVLRSNDPNEKPLKEKAKFAMSISLVRDEAILQLKPTSGLKCKGKAGPVSSSTSLSKAVRPTTTGAPGSEISLAEKIKMRAEAVHKSFGKAMRKRTLPGLLEEEDESGSEDGLDLHSGGKATPPQDLKKSPDGPTKVDQDVLNILPGQGRRFHPFHKGKPVHIDPATVKEQLHLINGLRSGFQGAGAKASPLTRGAVGPGTTSVELNDTSSLNDKVKSLREQFGAMALRQEQRMADLGFPRPPFQFPVFVEEDAPETFKGYLKEEGYLKEYRARLDKAEREHDK